MFVSNKANSRIKRIGFPLFGGRPWRPQDAFAGTPNATQLAPYRPGFAWSDAGITPAAPLGLLGRIGDQTGNGYNANQTGADSLKPRLGNIPRSGQRNRFLLATNNCSNTAWLKSGATVPADTIIENTANSLHQASRAVTIVSGSLYSFSADFVASGRFRGQILFYRAGTFGGVSVTFDLNAGTIGTPASFSGGASPSASIALNADGSYRVSLSGIADTGSTSAFVEIRLADAAGNTTYLGDGVSGMEATDLQFEAGTPTNYQQVNAAYDITESGVPTLQVPYYDGTDWMTLGVQSVGEADLFFEAGKPQWCAGAFSTFVSNAAMSVLSKSSNSDATTTFQATIRASGGGNTLSAFSRGGPQTNISGLVTDGLLHVWLIYWDGVTATGYVDGGAGVVIPVGVAAEEAQDILLGVRAAGTERFMQGFSDILGIRAGTLSTAQRTQLLRWMNQYYRGVTI